MARYIDKKTAQLPAILAYLNTFKTPGKNSKTDNDFYEMIEDDIRRNRDCKYYCDLLKLILDKRLYKFALDDTLNHEFVLVLEEYGYIRVTKRFYDAASKIEVIPHHEAEEGEYGKYGKPHNVSGLKTGTTRSILTDKWWV